MENLLEVKDLEVHFTHRSSLLNILLGTTKKGCGAVDRISFHLNRENFLLGRDPAAVKTTTG
jgi:ABC-type oligopeptide transport system ATPase subunit